MNKGISFYYNVAGELTPLPFAIIYASDKAGNYVDGNWMAQTDEFGFVEIPDNLSTLFITASWQTQKDVMPYSSVVSASDILTSISENELDPVIITDGDFPTDDEMIDDSKTFFLFLIGGLVAYKIYSS